MITTTTITAALLATLDASGLVERAATHSTSDLAAAMESLRDSPGSLAVVVPSGDEWDHTMEMPGENLPARSEWRALFEILITCRDTRHADASAPDTTSAKDAIAALLLWHELDTPGLLCLPTAAEPVVLERDGRRGREAWRLSLEVRMQIANSQ